MSWRRSGGVAFVSDGLSVFEFIDHPCGHSVTRERVTYLKWFVHQNLKWFVHQKMKMAGSTLGMRTTARWRPRSAQDRKPCTKQLIPVRTLIFPLTRLHVGLMTHFGCILFQKLCALKKGLCTTVVECTHYQLEMLQPLSNSTVTS